MAACAGALALLLAGAAMAATPLTPEQGYQENVLCAATMQQAAAENLLAPRYPADKVEPLAKVYMDEAQKSGAALGLRSAQTVQAVQTKRQSLIDALKAPATAASARTEQTKLAHVCTEIFGFEMTQRFKGMM